MITTLLFCIKKNSNIYNINIIKLNEECSLIFHMEQQGEQENIIILWRIAWNGQARYSFRMRTARRCKGTRREVCRAHSWVFDTEQVCLPPYGLPPFGSNVGICWQSMVFDVAWSFVGRTGSICAPRHCTVRHRCICLTIHLRRKDNQYKSPFQHNTWSIQAYYGLSWLKSELHTYVLFFSRGFRDSQVILRPFINMFKHRYYNVDFFLCEHNSLTVLGQMK